jgi:hypothetical protein
MARGDVKRYRGRGGGYGSYREYDDEGRGRSKEVWDNFQADYEASGHSTDWLMNDLSLDDLLDIFEDTTDRHRLHDCWDRTQKLTNAKGGEGTFDALRKRYEEEGLPYKEDRKWMNSIANEIAYLNLQRRRNEQQEAEIIKLENQTDIIRKNADLISGSLGSDVYQVFHWKEETELEEGEWLDDPVTTFIQGTGWGDEVREQGGVKLQITLTLDRSNSMYYNDVSDAARKAFVELGLALDGLQAEYPADLFTESFYFGYGDDGKLAQKLHTTQWERDKHEGDSCYLGKYERYRDDWGVFEGEDTWMAPLLRKIETWENEESDPGAVRLDLIISDAVLEHPTDVRACNEIQERRDGALQTIVLNLMPEEHWHEGTLPFRTVQYPVNADNLDGALRIIIQEFVGMNL